MGRPRQQSSGRPRRVEISVSRIEEHHVDAFGDLGDDWHGAAQHLMCSRRDGTGSALVALIDSCPVGLVGLRFDGAGWTVHDLQVHPDHRRRGVASRLLDGVEELARVTGRLRLEVDPANTPALTLYRARGFESTGAAMREPVDGEQIEMVKHFN